MDGEPATVTFVGNATTILRHGPFTLLTDPNFLHAGQRAHLGFGLSSRRLKDPALDVTELPPLDAVVLSHLHGDHWDRIAERHLDRDLPVLTTPAAARTLHRRGFRRSEGLETWRSTVLTKDDRQVRIIATPGRHAPGVFRRLLPPVMGTVLEFGPRGGPPDLTVHISGDTLLCDALAEIRRRFPHLDAGIVHLGGTRLLGLLTVTMDGRQGAAWVDTVDVPTVVPVHYDDYTVFKSGLPDFEGELARRGLHTRLLRVPRGATRSLLTRPGVRS